MSTKPFWFKIILVCLITIITCISLGGCTKTEQSGRKSINTCIEQLHMDYGNIYELTCDPGDEFSLLGTDYDLLEKLVNLESIKLIGIGSKDDAQKFFAELTKLKKLKKVEIVDSKIGSIGKLGDIENLIELSIVGNANGGEWFSIDDIELLGSDERFDNLQSLSLKFINLDKIPNLKQLENLQSLTISGREITSIEVGVVDWNQLTSLEISNTSVTSIDLDIVKQLKNLRSLDISYSKFKNVSFVNELPELENFKFLGYPTDDVYMECIKEHPNYKDSWLYK